MSAVDNALKVIHDHDQLLLDQLQPLEQEASELEARLATIHELRDEIKSRLKVPPEKKSSPKRQTRRASRPCAKKADVLLALRDLVSQNQPIDRSDLESLAKHKLRDEQNFSLSGVKLRLQECLSSDEFSIDDAGFVSLKKGNLSVPTAVSDSASQTVR
ncbi:hypothetical protein [Rhodopirellula europaea]|uniref:hypothetical protein n=1 Tax=Rhodopirellula europaea TaxID=1263866 RepID=UPI003D2A80EC